MLIFFRKHQKAFLFVVAAVVIVSFFLAGIAEMNFSSQSSEGDPVETADRSTVTKEHVARFISTDANDLSDERIGFPNLFNDGILAKDFFGSPLGIRLAENHFSDLQSDLLSVFQKITLFRSGSGSSMSAKLWGRFFPGVEESVAGLLSEAKNPSLETFSELSRLYALQKSIPLGFLQRMASYDNADTHRENFDPSLLGLHSAQDWFGPLYLEKVAELILESAKAAEESGISVSFFEAKESLLRTLGKNLENAGEKIPEARLPALVTGLLGKEGLSEKQGIEIWKNILLFRKFFASVKAKAVLDPSVEAIAYQNSKDLLTAEFFSLPEMLRTTDFLSVLRAYLYIESIGNFSLRGELFPETSLSVAEVQKKHPDLVRRKYVLEYADLDLGKAVGKIGFKEAWDWQATKTGQNVLEKRFSFLSPEGRKEKLSFSEALEELDDTVRAEVDLYSKERILASDPVRIRSALEECPKKRDTVYVGKGGEGLPYKYLRDPLLVLELMETASLPEGKVESSKQRTAKEALSLYTQDGLHYYTISVIERAEEPEILSFFEADKSGVLRKMLDKKLESCYATIDKKGRPWLLQKDGSKKPFSEVKEKIGTVLFADRCRAIEASYARIFGTSPTEAQKGEPSFYARYAGLVAGEEARRRIASGIRLEGLAALWDCSSRHHTVGRRSKEVSLSEEEFAIPTGDLSPVRFISSGENLFFRVESRSEKERLSEEEIRELRIPVETEALLTALQTVEERIRNRPERGE